jgi:hypothetical protein
MLMKGDGIHLLAHHAHHDFVPPSKVFFEYLYDGVCIFLDSMRLAISLAWFHSFYSKIFAKSFDIFITSRGKMLIAIRDGEDSKFHGVSTKAQVKSTKFKL